MGFLGKLIGAAVNTVLVPVDVAMDVVTLGGSLTEKEEPYTSKRVKKVFSDIEESAEDASDGDFL